MSFFGASKWFLFEFVHLNEEMRREPDVNSRRAAPRVVRNHERVLRQGFLQAGVMPPQYIGIEPHCVLLKYVWHRDTAG